MIEDGYNCINDVYDLLYIVPGAGTFHDYLDIATDVRYLGGDHV